MVDETEQYDLPGGKVQINDDVKIHVDGFNISLSDAVEHQNGVDTISIPVEEAESIAWYLERYATRDDAPWGPDEKEANDLSETLWERIAEKE